MPAEQDYPSVTSYPTQLKKGSAWEGMGYSTFSGYSPAMELSIKSQVISQVSSPVDYYSSTSSEYSVSSPLPTLVPESPSSDYQSSFPSTPVTPARPYPEKFPIAKVDPARLNPNAKIKTPKGSRKTEYEGRTPKPAKQKGPKIKDTDNLTPQQLKRRLQNRISQAAVRRRRNSPARILEARLQLAPELSQRRNMNIDQSLPPVPEARAEQCNHQQQNLPTPQFAPPSLITNPQWGGGVSTSQIESCIQTLNEEIRMLRELQIELASQESSIVASLIPFRFGSGIGGDEIVGHEAVDQRVAYQNHEFDSNFMADPPS